MNTMVVSVAAMCHHMARAQARKISSRPRPDVYVDTAAMLSHFTSSVLPLSAEDMKARIAATQFTASKWDMCISPKRGGIYLYM